MPVSIDLDLGLNLSFLAAGAWASARHFARDEREPAGATLLTLATVVGTALNVWHALRHPNMVRLDADLAIAISLAAFVVFFAAIRATRRRGLSLAFSERTPGAVIHRGIYRVIRHPFYASYILSAELAAAHLTRSGRLRDGRDHDRGLQARGGERGTAAHGATRPVVYGVGAADMALRARRSLACIPREIVDARQSFASQRAGRKRDRPFTTTKENA